MRWRIVAILVLTATGCAFAGDSPKSGLEAAREERLAAAREAARERVAAIVADVDAGRGQTSVREIHALTTKHNVKLRYRQLHFGIPVWASVLIVTVSPTGIRDTNTFKRDLSVNIVPNLDEAAALKIARNRLKLKGQHRADAKLMILPRTPDGGLTNIDRLVWQVEVWTENHEDGVVDRTFFVDAHSGEILLDESMLHEVTHAITQPQFRGMYSTSSIYTVTPVNNKGILATDGKIADPCFGTGVLLPPGTAADCGVPQEFDNFLLLVAKGVGNWVGNAKGTTKETGKPMEYNRSNPVGDGLLTSTDPKTAAADVFFHMFKVFKYLQLQHEHQGLDGSNGPQMHAMVNTAYQNNAIWSEKNDCVLVGQAGGDHHVFAAIDIIAHEIGHALGEHVPHLVLFKKSQIRETWAVGEATSDMFALLVSEYHKRPDLPGTWPGDPVPFWIGEETFRANYIGSTFTSQGHAIRYMDDPARKPGTVACYYPEIRQLNGHLGAGPADHMFYLLTYGGVSKCNGKVVEGIGVANAATIFWDAFSDLSEDATYAELRSKFLTSAMALFPGPTPIVLSTASAFEAVNVP